LLGKYLSPGLITAGKFLELLAKNTQTSHRFTKPIDLVYIGTCSAGKSKRPRPHTTNEIGQLSRNYFKKVPAKSVVLVISECCGQYNKEFQRDLRREHPKTEWIFPEHFDYFGTAEIPKILSDLVKAGLLH